MRELAGGVIIALILAFLEYKGIFWNPSAFMCITCKNLIILNLLFIAGAFFSTNLLGSFAIKIPRAREFVKALIGGILMGIGCIIALEGNISGGILSFAGMSVGGLLMFAGLVIGMYFGVIFEIKELEKYPSTGAVQIRFPKLNYIFAILALGIIWLLMDKHYLLGIFALLGAVFGASRWCMFNGFKEPFVSEKVGASLGLIFCLLIITIITAVLKFNGIIPKDFGILANFGVGGFAGGLIFGLGMGIAGGGIESILWRTGEGDLKYLVAGASFLSMVTAGKYILKKAIIPGQKLFMPKLIGYPGAVAVFLAIPLLWLLIVLWNKKTKRLIKRYF